MKQRVDSLRKINKMEKALAKVTKSLRENIQINKIKSEKVDIRTDTEEVQRLLRINFTDLYCTKPRNLKESIPSK